MNAASGKVSQNRLQLAQDKTTQLALLKLSISMSIQTFNGLLTQKLYLLLPFFLSFNIFCGLSANFFPTITRSSGGISKHDEQLHKTSQHRNVHLLHLLQRQTERPTAIIRWVGEPDTKYDMLTNVIHLFNVNNGAALSKLIQTLSGHVEKRVLLWWDQHFISWSRNTVGCLVEAHLRSHHTRSKAWCW